MASRYRPSGPTAGTFLWHKYNDPGSLPSLVASLPEGDGQPRWTGRARMPAAPVLPGAGGCLGGGVGVEGGLGRGREAAVGGRVRGRPWRGCDGMLRGWIRPGVGETG